MGQKVHPEGLRVGYIHDWKANWFNEKDFSDYLFEDIQIRRHIIGRLAHAGLSDITIRKNANEVEVNINTARPGIVIGKSGSEVDALRRDLHKITNKQVKVNILEIKRPELDARLVAQSIAEQLQNRVAFRRAMKRALTSAMRSGAKGVKVQVSGRLGGAEMARTEGYSDGRVPLHTLRADIDYGFHEARTTFGRIGVKCWINKGEIMPEGYTGADLTQMDEAAAGARSRTPRRARRRSWPRRSRRRSGWSRRWSVGPGGRGGGPGGPRSGGPGGRGGGPGGRGGGPGGPGGRGGGPGGRGVAVRVVAVAVRAARRWSRRSRRRSWARRSRSQWTPCSRGDSLMLSPKRVKFRKQHRGRRRGLSRGQVKVQFGEYGLKAMDEGWLTNRQIEAARIAMTRKIKRGGKVWINVYPDKPYTKKPAETRMGSGKGSPEGWVAVVKPGRVMFELAGVPEPLAREAMRLAGHKLPVKTRFVLREDG